MTRGNLRELIATYGDVILKPLGGSRGTGVIRVSSKGNHDYQIHSENKKTVVHGLEAAYGYAKRKTGGRTYIAQRRIPLATVDDRPFDIRAIVQRKRHSKKWKVTGKVAKVAGRGYIVTNITRSKGRLMGVKTAVETSSLRGHSSASLISSVDRTAILTAERLRRIYPHQRMYGMDLGLDRNGHVWVIEANRKPMLSHFRKLHDKTMYRRIMRYKKS
jgi:glutathione synthase/RimK-type ligase-like ATP-grasp enzyme